MKAGFRFLIFIIIFTFACFIVIHHRNRAYKLDKEQWIFKDILQTNMNALSKIKKKNGDEFELITKYTGASNRLLRLPEARTSVCYTDWGIVWRVLFGVKLGVNAYREATDDELILYNNLEDMKKELKLDKNMTDETFVFVKKDPLERVIDEYMQSCIENRHPCFGCGFDFVCHLEKLHNHMQIVEADNATMHPDYIRYIPLNWFCEMREMRNRFIILDDKVVKEKMYDKEYAFLSEADRNEVGTVNITGSIKTKGLLIDMVTTNQYLLDLFMATYYWDYVVFNYTIPELKMY